MSTRGLDQYIEREDFRTERLSLQVVRQVFRDLATEKNVFAWGTLCVLLGTAATLAEPHLFGIAIDRAILPRDVGALQDYAVIYLILVTLRAGATLFQFYIFEVLAQRMMQRLRLRLFDHLQRLPVATFDRTPVGRMITRITNDTSAMSEMFSAGFVTFFGNLLFIIGVFGWLFYQNPKLAAIATSVFPILIFFSIRFSRTLIRLFREARMKMSAMNAFLAENILGMRIVHLFSRRQMHFARFQSVNEEHAQTQMGTIQVYAFFQPLITWCSGAGVALVLYVGGRDALRGVLSPGELVAFISYLMLLFQPIRELVDRWTIFLSGMTSAERIYALMGWVEEMPPEETRGRPEHWKPLQGEIEFKNVWFAYSGENWVLKDFSLRIRPGEKIGIVGHTGAGKTTLIALLLRFYDVQRGEILIDGKRIQDYPRRELRAAFGLIQQDVFVFSGTLEENVLMGTRGEVLTAEVKEALSSFGMLSRRDDVLVERGANLSMGERQVLSFARALQKKPDLWILDEATSNIDSRTEQIFAQILDTFTQGRTLLMIAHRLATVRNADRILVLHRGELIESGRHEELMQRDGAYARLYRYQVSSLEEVPEGLSDRV